MIKEMFEKSIELMEEQRLEDYQPVVTMITSTMFNPSRKQFEQISRLETVVPNPFGISPLEFFVETFGDTYKMDYLIDVFKTGNPDFEDLLKNYNSKKRPISIEQKYQLLNGLNSNNSDVSSSEDNENDNLVNDLEQTESQKSPNLKCIGLEDFFVDDDFDDEYDGFYDDSLDENSNKLYPIGFICKNDSVDNYDDEDDDDYDDEYDDDYDDSIDDYDDSLFDYYDDDDFDESDDDYDDFLYNDDNYDEFLDNDDDFDDDCDNFKY